MTMTRWAFIYTLGDDATDVRIDLLGSDGCVLVAVGVPAPSFAAATVDQLIEDGVQLIELCGAFGPAETADVQRAIDGRVPLGAVAYPCSEAGGLSDLFG